MQNRIHFALRGIDGMLYYSLKRLRTYERRGTRRYAVT